MIEGVLDLIQQDMYLLSGKDWFQELVCHLPLLRVYTTPFLKSDNPALVANKSISRFQTWSKVPPVVCVVICLPNADARSPSEAGSFPNPHLSTSICGLTFSHRFGGLDMWYGKLSFEGSGENTRALIVEDPEGKGNSPLIVSFLVPSAAISREPLVTRVRLQTVTTPQISLYGKGKWCKLKDVVLFDIPLEDSTKVHIFKQPLSASKSKPVHIHYSPPPLKGISEGLVQVNLDKECQKVATLSPHVDFSDDEHGKALLRSKENVVEVKQASHFNVELRVGSGGRQQTRMPFAVSAADTKLRFARESARVEVRSPICATSRRY